MNRLIRRSCIELHHSAALYKLCKHANGSVQHYCAFFNEFAVFRLALVVVA